MNLNGEKKKSTTILNGEPCYGYDRDKAVQYQIHRKKHTKWTERWRKEPNKEIDRKTIIYGGTITAILIVIVLCAFMIFVL